MLKSAPGSDDETSLIVAQVWVALAASERRKGNPTCASRGQHEVARGANTPSGGKVILIPAWL
jgi:hypothetical protein